MFFEKLCIDFVEIFSDDFCFQRKCCIFTTSFVTKLALNVVILHQKHKIEVEIVKILCSFLLLIRIVYLYNNLLRYDGKRNYRDLSF